MKEDDLPRIGNGHSTLVDTGPGNQTVKGEIVPFLRLWIPSGCPCENTRFLDITLNNEGHIATVYTVIGSKDLRTPVFLHRQAEFVIKSARQT
ncbi:MAG: hypothetical protein QF569_08000 [Candidatus Poribacteria bacterium]|nr:hypothetical protein [Candidatus Poribacteria bacterium]